MDITSSTNPCEPVNGHFCSVCGRTLNEFEIDDKLVINVTLGYGSRYDEQTHEVKFCHNCFDALLNSCKRPTLIKDHGA